MSRRIRAPRYRCECTPRSGQPCGYCQARIEVTEDHLGDPEPDVIDAGTDAAERAYERSIGL